ncbi:glycosyltransferase [Limosilactobacillus fermentum]|nr:glycosyltransferase [Limosilactobacillus fermentum]
MDLFILPSFFEGLPVVLVEAQASSLPCLVSDSVTREVEVTDRIEFLSLKEDASVWANKLNELLVKFNNRKDEILAIRKHGYDIHDVSKKLEKLYIQYNGE